MKTLTIYSNIFIIILLLTSMSVFAQNPPYISSIDKTNGSTGETVLILGVDFPTNQANLSVKFGAAEATIISTSATQIEASVPANATFDNITVTDTSTGLTAYSNEAFNISHGGNVFTSGDFDPIHTEVTGGTTTQDLCMCDFDDNGTNDIVTTNNESNSINIFTNNSTSTTINLTKNDIDLGIESINLTCGDLNGDGKSDLVVSRGGSASNSFFIFRNTSTTLGTITFDEGGRLTVQLPAQTSGDVRSPRKPIIQDIDLDGKPDIILSNDKDNIVFIYKNSSTGSISLEATPIQITVDQITVSTGIDVKDLNNDGFPEIMLIDDLADNVYVLPNNSEPGTITIGDVNILSTSLRLKNVKSGDLNQDGFNDIIATSTSSNGGSIAIFENTTSTIGGTISFSNPTINADTDAVWGVDLFDAEGDGDLDIVAASLSNRVYILVNSNPSDLTTSFQLQEIVLGENVRNIKSGDINMDGKPDLAFTYRSAPSTAGQLGILTNRNCVLPTITPGDARTICTGTTLRLEATGALGATYNWLLDGGSVKMGADNFIDITGTPGTYTVEVSDGMSCNETSNAVVITLGTDPNVTTTAGNDTSGDPVCVGTTVNLSTNTITGATYSWTGPNGYTSPLQNPELLNITADMAGIYSVTAEANGCTSNASTTTVLVETVPVISVRNSNQDIFCTGSSIELNVTAQAGSYDYQWIKDDVNIDGATNTTLTVTEGGMYKATITSTGVNTCSFESTAREITEVAVPVPSFNRSDTDGILTGSNSSICRDLAVDFMATSTGGSGLAINNAWDFGDTNSDTGDNVSNIYTTAGNITITLTATYADVQSCSTTEQISQNLTITDTPVVDIATAGNVTEKCPSEELLLSIPNNFSNYLWSSGETVSNISVLDPAIYSVSATDEFGCDFTTADIDIRNFASSGIDINVPTGSAVTIDPVTRNIDIADGQLSIELTVDNAVDGTIAWTPASLIADTTLRTVTVAIEDINTLVTVFGDDAEGCMESDTVRILNNNIRAKKVFSPNGDGIGDDCWEITNSRSDTGFSGCKIFIFDSKGRTVQQSNGPFPNDCVWEGNINGSPAPEGVYYYALKCSDNNLSLTGSILLAR